MLTPDRQATATDGHPLGPGTVLRGRYLLKERLDYGRFGLICKALDRQSVGWDGLPGHVAVLILPPEVVANRHTLAAVREDFVRLRSLSHPSIVNVFDFDADGDVYFMTMEYVDGESLRTVLDHLQPELLWHEEALDVVHAVGTALDFAHRSGIAHGDVRPENIIVSGAREVKLLFASTCLLRSPPFATEPRDDVFGLGCLAYELFTGMQPFAGGGAAGVEPAREPRRIKGLPRRQWDALRASLAPRDRRTRSVARFLADMRLGTSAPRRIKRPRRRVGRSFAVVALLALVGAAAYLYRGPLGGLTAPSAPLDGLVADAAAPGRSAVPARQPPAPPEVATATAADAAAPGGSAVPARQPPAPPEVATAAAADAAAPGGSAVPARQPPAPPEVAQRQDSDALVRRVSNAAPAESNAFGFATREVRVSEAGSVAAVDIVRLAGGGVGSVAWWTSDGTATADEDYANFGAVIETFAPGERRRTIRIPITADAVAEDRESFYVNLREGPEGAGAHPDAVTRVTITIVDDD